MSFGLWAVGVDRERDSSMVFVTKRVRKGKQYRQCRQHALNEHSELLDASCYPGPSNHCKRLRWSSRE